MPAARAFLFLGLATSLLAVAAVVPGLGALAAAVDAAVLVLVLVDHRRGARIAVSARRSWPPLLVQGAAAEIEVRLSADRPVRLRLREALHPALAESPLRTELAVGPRTDSVWRYTLHPRRRGEHTIGPLSARLLGPWGFAWSQRELLGPEERRVYPQVRWEGRVGRLLALAHRRELGQAPVRRHGIGVEPYALREHRPGDPPTRIHWKASARHGKLISREDTWERGRRLVVLLDCARAMASVAGGRSKLDHALAATLALIRVAAGRGDRVTVVAFSDRVERVVRVSAGRDARAYDALYDLEARLVEPAYDLAAETSLSVEPRTASLFLLTSVVDLAAAELLREAVVSARRRHRPVLVNLEDPELNALALGIPASAPEAFAKVASLEILLANRRLGRRLSRAGIRLVTTSADRLAWDTLESYLELGRGRGSAEVLARLRA
jgi:uncharacterized protein (DUF58 family)